MLYEVITLGRTNILFGQITRLFINSNGPVQAFLIILLPRQVADLKHGNQCVTNLFFPTINLKSRPVCGYGTVKIPDSGTNLAGTKTEFAACHVFAP